MSRTPLFAVAALSIAGLALALPPKPVAAEPGFAPSGTESTPTVTVTAKGLIKTKVSQYELALKLKAFAESPEEAVQKFDQIRTRAVAGLTEAGPEGMTIAGSGVTLKFGEEAKDDAGMSNMMFAEMGGGGPEVTEGLNLAEVLRVRMPAKGDAVEARAQAIALIETAADLGLSFDSIDSGEDGMSMVTSPMAFYGGESRPTSESVRGGLDDELKQAASSKARAAAMAEARAMAAELAGLSARELGQVMTITQQSQSSSWNGLGSGVETTCTLQVTFQMK